MALTSEPADPTQRAELGLEPKSFAEAVEEALERDDDPPLDESIIKESPPQLHPSFTRSTSEARPLGEVMDEIERSPAPGSPVLRHPRGRLENKSSHDSHMSSADKPTARSNGTIDGHVDDHSDGIVNGTPNGNISGAATQRTNGNKDTDAKKGSTAVHEQGADHRKARIARSHKSHGHLRARHRMPRLINHSRSARIRDHGPNPSRTVPSMKRRNREHSSTKVYETRVVKT